jgi:hypothetical protein
VRRQRRPGAPDALSVAVRAGSRLLTREGTGWGPPPSPSRTLPRWYAASKARRLPTRVFAAFAAVGVAVGAGCDAGKTILIGHEDPVARCLLPPTAPPAGTPAFYKKYLDAYGIPVQSSAAVSDTVLASACLIAVNMVRFRADVREEMIQERQRVAVLGLDEVTTDVPEYANLYTMFPGPEWDALRGVGATIAIPVSSVGQENLLCLTNDPYAGEQVLVQTFATAVLLALERVDGSTFGSRVTAAYDAAMRAGLWQNTYAMENRIEYYAVGVQAWFDAKPDVSPPDGIHNDINTRAELIQYDPILAGLVAESMPDDDWRPTCPATP